MSDRLTVAVPEAMLPAVAEIVVSLGIADGPDALPGPHWQGHGGAYIALSGIESEERIAALLAGTEAADLPLIVLGREDSPPPGPGAILAARGDDGLAALAAMGLERVPGEA